MFRTRMQKFQQEKDDLEVQIRDYKPAKDQSKRTFNSLMKRLTVLRENHKEQPRLAVLVGMLHEAAKDRNAAYAAYAQARKEFPLCPHAYIYATKMLYEDKNYKAAKRLANQFTTKFQNDATLHFKHRQEMIRLSGQIDTAMQKLEMDKIESTRHLQAVFKNNPYRLLENEEVVFPKSPTPETAKTVTKPTPTQTNSSAVFGFFARVYNYFTTPSAAPEPTVEKKRSNYRF